MAVFRRTARNSENRLKAGSASGNFSSPRRHVHTCLATPLPGLSVFWGRRRRAENWTGRLRHAGFSEVASRRCRPENSQSAAATAASFSSKIAVTDTGPLPRRLPCVGFRGGRLPQAPDRAGEIELAGLRLRHHAVEIPARASSGNAPPVWPRRSRWRSPPSRGPWRGRPRPRADFETPSSPRSQSAASTISGQAGLGVLR